MTDVAPFKVENIEILHCCLQRGVKLRLDLKPTVSIQEWRNLDPGSFYAVEKDGHGFFRLLLANKISISGVIGGHSLTIMFSFLQKDKCLETLNTYFYDFSQLYKLVSDE